MTALGDTFRTLGSLPFTSLKSPEQIAAGEAKLRELMKTIDPSSRLALVFEYAIRDLQIQQSRARKAPPEEIRKQVESLVAFLTQHKDRGVFLLTGRNDLDRFLRKYGLATAASEQ